MGVEGLMPNTFYVPDVRIDRTGKVPWRWWKAETQFLADCRVWAEQRPEERTPSKVPAIKAARSAKGN